MDKDYKEIARYSEKYLLERINNDSTRLDYYLNEWKYKKPKNLKSVFRKMLMHSQNRQGMPNTIGDIDKLRVFLFDFDARKVADHYRKWEMVFEKIQQNYKPPGRMIITNSKSYWVIFCKSILSISRFLSRFEDMARFEKYVSQFVRTDNADLRIALPLLLSEEIFGFRFALACDFIKENISSEFIKPDTHIKDIFKGIGICKEVDSDFEVFRKVINFSGIINKKPYWVDKLFWLAGSGRFYPTARYPMEFRFESSKSELIKLLNQEV